MWEVAAQNPLKCKRTMPRPRQLDMNTLTAAPKHAELVAVLRGLHMATGASQGVIITGTDLTLVTLHSFTWIYVTVPAAAEHLPPAQSEVGAGRGGDQPVRGHTWLPGQCPTGCRLAAL